MKSRTAILLRLSFIAAIVASIPLIYLRAKENDWNTVIAAISLIIAVISAWVAFETFHQQALAQRPQLVIQPNFEDRAGLILIKIKNHGEKPAYNISVKWSEPIVDSKGQIFSFSKGSKEYDFLVLGKNDCISTLLDGETNFYEKFKDSDLEYSGIISYSESLSSKKRYKQEFYISLTSHKRLKKETDIAITHSKLQSIPDHLSSLEREIRNLRKELIQLK